MQILRGKLSQRGSNWCKKPGAEMRSEEHGNSGRLMRKSGRCEWGEDMGLIMEALDFVLTVTEGMWKILNRVVIRAE